MERGCLGGVGRDGEDDEAGREGGAGRGVEVMVGWKLRGTRCQGRESGGWGRQREQDEGRLRFRAGRASKPIWLAEDGGEVERRRGVRGKSGLVHDSW